MANSLDQELEGKYVILDKKVYSKTKDDIERIFLCKNGFGCSATTHGKAIFGEFVFDGECCRIGGFEVKRLAKEQEIEEAKKRFLERKKGEQKEKILEEAEKKADV